MKALIAGAAALVTPSAWACATCGQSFSFSPTMILVSAGFFVLPVGIAGFIAWKLWKDERKSRDRSP